MKRNWSWIIRIQHLPLWWCASAWSWSSCVHSSKVSVLVEAKLLIGFHKGLKGTSIALFMAASLRSRCLLPRHSLRQRSRPPVISSALIFVWAFSEYECFRIIFKCVNYDFEWKIFHFRSIAAKFKQKFHHVLTYDCFTLWSDKIVLHHKQSSSYSFC